MSLQYTLSPTHTEAETHKVHSAARILPPRGLVDISTKTTMIQKSGENAPLLDSYQLSKERM